MRKIMWLIASLFILTAVGLAQPLSEEKLNRTVENYIVGLASDNSGLRHDAIFQIVKVRCAYPEQSLDAALEKLQKMAARDANPIIRLHAELATICLKDTRIMTKIQIREQEDAVMFFNRLYQELNTSAFALQL